MKMQLFFLGTTLENFYCPGLLWIGSAFLSLVQVELIHRLASGSQKRKQPKQRFISVARRLTVHFLHLLNHEVSFTILPSPLLKRLHINVTSEECSDYDSSCAKVKANPPRSLASRHSPSTLAAASSTSPQEITFER